MKTTKPYALFVTLALGLAACADREPEGVIIDEGTRELAGNYTAAWNSGEPSQVAAYDAPDGVLAINGGEPAAGREAVVALGAEIFPADHSLARAEDGVALEDGSLLVADQAHGLRRLYPDGRSEPFGDMPVAGYRHEPPEHPGGANGISLEPAGTHVLVADIFGGGIYRVALEDGGTQRIHQHRFGVNVAVRDSTGAIWFTQSAHNPPEQGEARMWAAIDRPLEEGALLRLAVDASGFIAPRPETVIDGLRFANGIAIDEEAGALYLAESSALRVTRYDVDLAAGSVGNPQVIIEGVLPDNLELDSAGRLYVGAPLPNTVLVHDPATGETRSLLPPPTPERQAMQAEWQRRLDAGEPLMELVTPEAWAPLPGFVTGVILGARDGSLYLTGLSNTLVALPSR